MKLVPALTLAALIAAVLAPLGASPAEAADTSPTLSINSTVPDSQSGGGRGYGTGSRARFTQPPTLDDIKVTADADSSAGTFAFDLHIRPAAGQRLRLGESTTRSNISGTASDPVVTVGSRGLGADISGVLDVLDLAADASGRITRLHLTFRSATAATAYFGELRYGLAEPAVSAAPQESVWPLTPIGSTPIVGRHWVENRGATAVAVGRATVTGPAAADYTVRATSCPTSLAPGARCWTDLGFSPRAGGPRLASLDIPVGGSTTRIPLTGSAGPGTTSFRLSGAAFPAMGTTTTWSDGGGTDIVQRRDGTSWTWYPTFPYLVGAPPKEFRLTVDNRAMPITLGRHDFSPTSSGPFSARLAALGGGCNDYAGSAVVTDIAQRADGTIDRASIDFEMWCVEAPADHMTANLRWNARSDITAPAAPTGLARTGATVGWSDSTVPDRAGWIVRLVAGDGRTATATSGHSVYAGTARTIAVPAIPSGSAYSLAVFAVDTTGNTSPGSVLSMGAGSPTPPTPSGPPERLPEPGFEAGLGDWKVFTSGTTQITAGPVHGGSKAIAMTAAGTAPGLVGLTQNSAIPSSTGGRSYAFSCWVRPTGTSVQVVARLLQYTTDFGSNTKLVSTTVTLPANTWTRVAATGVATESGRRIIPQIYSMSQVIASGAVIYDDCSLTG